MWQAVEASSRYWKRKERLALSPSAEKYHQEVVEYHQGRRRDLQKRICRLQWRGWFHWLLGRSCTSLVSWRAIEESMPPQGGSPPRPRYYTYCAAEPWRGLDTRTVYHEEIYPLWKARNGR
jgi:hypothetical protein